MTLLSAVLVAAFATELRAQPVRCDSPRDAVETLFAWQQPASLDLAKASRCLERSGRTASQLQEAAAAIRAAYDSRGLRVPIEELSDDPRYRDPSTGAQALAPHPSLPSVVVARAEDGRWLWTQASIDRALQLSPLTGSAIERWGDGLPSGFQGELFGVKVWQYLALFLVVLFALVVRKVLAFVVENRIGKLIDTWGKAWAVSVVRALASPGATIVMAILLRIVYPAIGLPLGAALVLSIAVRVLIVASLVWLAYGFVDVLAARMAKQAEQTHSKLDDQLVPLVRRLLKIIVLLTGGVFILQNLDVDVGSLLAGLGIGGLAFALAAKDTLANFFGSVMIFVDKPFQIGDWVKMGDVEGIVEEVGFRSTRIRTFYDSVITMPNAKFTESAIDNLGMRNYRRIYVTLNLTYDTKPEQMQAFVEGLRAIVAAHPQTRKDKYEIHMSGFGAHSLDVMLYIFVQVTSWSDELRARHQIFLEVMRLAHEVGVSFAFPTQTLLLDYVRQAGEPRDVPEPKPSQELAKAVEAFGPGGALSRPEGPKLTHGYLPGQKPD